MSQRPSSLYLLVGGASYPFFRLLFRARWHGAANVPRAGGAVLASNHLSNWDAFALALGVYPRRWLRFMAKVELFRPPLAWLIDRLGAFPVDRANPGRDVIATAIRLCREGQVVVMFPEGTRRGRAGSGDGAAEPHSGAARIALRAGVPLIPAAIKGTNRASHLGPVVVAYGAPLALDDLAARDRRAAAEEATRRLMAEIERLERSL